MGNQLIPENPYDLQEQANDARNREKKKFEIFSMPERALCPYLQVIKKTLNESANADDLKLRHDQKHLIAPSIHQLTLEQILQEHYLM